MNLPTTPFGGSREGLQIVLDQLSLDYDCFFDELSTALNGLCKESSDDPTYHLRMVAIQKPSPLELSVSVEIGFQALLAIHFSARVLKPDAVVETLGFPGFSTRPFPRRLKSSEEDQLSVVDPPGNNAVHDLKRERNSTPSVP